MRGSKPFLALLLLPCLLAGCSLLNRAKSYNQHYFLKQEVAEIEAKLRSSPPSLRPPKTLYLYDEKGVYQQQLTDLLHRLPTNDPLTQRVAQLLGDGLALLERATDTLQLINAHLLMDNPTEASRLLALWSNPDPASQAVIALAQGDTLNTIHHLEELLKQPKSPLAYRAARLWHHLDASAQAPLHYLSRKSPSQWERFTATVELGGSPTGNTVEEQAYITYRSALQQPDTLHLQKATEQLLQLPESEWQTAALLTLRPLLYQQEQWITVLALQQALPAEYQADYPYLLLTEYQQEIKLLQSYRQSSASPTSTSNAPTTATPTTPTDGSFRSKWGNVANVDNWAMQQSTSFHHPSATLPFKPTFEQYQTTLRHLHLILPHH